MTYKVEALGFPVSEISTAKKEYPYWVGEEFYRARMKRYEMECESQAECTSWIRLFRAFDLDHDGYIPTNELKKAIRESTFSFGLDADEIDKITKDIDRNHDHLIDFPEFCILMSRAKRFHLRHVVFRAAQFVIPRSKRTEPYSYLQRYKCCPPPVFMLLVSIIQIAVYVYYAIDSGEGISVNGPVPTKSPFIYNPLLKEEIWRFLTYMLIHIGVYHMVFNVFTQLILGIPLELVHQWRVVLVYLGGVITGSLMVAAVDPYVYLAGASGGVYALLAAHLAELIMNWKEMEFNWVRLLIISILVGSDAGLAVYQRYYTDRTDKVSYVSHIGGFIAGILLGIVLLRNFRKHRWERALWWISLVSFVMLWTVCAVLIFFPNLIRF